MANITETDGNVSIASKVPIPSQLVSVSVSIFLQYRYQTRDQSISRASLRQNSYQVKSQCNFFVSWMDRPSLSIGFSIGLDSGPPKVSTSSLNF